MLRQLCNVFVNHAETRTPVLGNIRGNIPAWLRGNFLFTAPGLLDIPPIEPSQPLFSVNHYGDGYALLGNIHFQGQDKVTLATRFLQSDAYRKAVTNGRTVLPEYATPSSPDGTAPKKKGGLFALLAGERPPTSDNANHAIYRIGDSFYATNGQAYFTQFNPSDLHTGPKFEAKKLFGLNNLGAHPLTDANGNFWNFGAAIGATSGATTSFIKITPDGPDFHNFENFQKIAAIPSATTTHVSSIHSFGMTANYLIFADSPATLNLPKFMRTAISGSDYAILDLVEWLPDYRNKFHVVDKNTGEVLTANAAIETKDPFFYSHVTNCYEVEETNSDGRHLVVDIHTFPNMTATLGATIQNFKDGVPLCAPEEEGALQRFKIPLGNSQGVNVAPEDLTARGISSIVTNKRYTGVTYRYCYGHGSYTRGTYAHSIVKFDLENSNGRDSREISRWDGGEQAYLTEVSFVENPEAGQEDDGVLIGGVCDLRGGERDYMIILNARDLKEIGRVEFECKLPFYIHGLFVPE